MPESSRRPLAVSLHALRLYTILHNGNLHQQVCLGSSSWSQALLHKEGEATAKSRYQLQAVICAVHFLASTA